MAKSGKEVMDDVVKYHFWILSGVVLVTMVTCWYIATGAIKREIDEYKTAVDGSYASVRQVRSAEFHPNTDSHDALKAIHKVHRLQLAEAWRQQEQNQKKILVWPQEFDAGFRAAAANLVPIEEKVPFPSGEEIREAYRQYYREYVGRQLPKISQQIGAVWKIGTGEGAQTQEDTVDEDEKVLVKWAADSQRNLSTRFVWDRGTPSTLEVLYAQEDLWILNAIANVIQRTNANAETRKMATVREIVSIDIAKAVQGVADVGKVHTWDGKQVKLPSAGDAEGGGGGSMGGMEAMMGAMEGTDGMGTPGGGGADGPGSLGVSDDNSSSPSASSDPAHLRYVDNAFEPIPANRLREAIKSTNVEDAPLAVAKRIPVRVRLKLDLHKVPAVLAACGNSELPIQVRQVRINGPSGASTMSGGGGDMMTMMMNAGGGESVAEGISAGGSMEMMQSAGGGAGLLGAAAKRNLEKRQAKESYPYQEEVELYGVVYIYNPFDPAKIGLTAEDMQEAGAANGGAGNAAE